MFRLTKNLTAQPLFQICAGKAYRVDRQAALGRTPVRCGVHIKRRVQRDDYEQSSAPPSGSLANREEALYQIGKNGHHRKPAPTLSDALEARELIKITVQEYAPLTPKEAMGELTDRLGCEPRCRSSAAVGCLPREQNE